MRNLQYLAILGLLTSCTHPAVRGPAAAAPTCASQMASTFNGGELQKSFAQTKIDAAAHTEYYQSTYPKEVREFLKKAANPKRDCETERDIQAYSTDLDNKTRTAAAIIHAAVANQPLAMFGGSSSGETLACYSACESAMAQGHAQTQTCEAQCGVDDSYSLFFFQNLPLVKLMNTCFPADSDPAQSRTEFLAQFARYAPGYVEMLKQQQPELQKLADEFTESKAALDLLRPELNKLITAPRCRSPKYAWLPAVQAATSQVRTNVDSASAFYAKAGAQRFLVTAMHVPRLSPQSPSGPVQVVDMGGNVKVSLTAELIPNQSDISRDINMTAAPAVGPTVKIVSSQETPAVGQRFYVVGYPAGKFTVTRCTFQGFGARLNGMPDAAYRLFCPGVGNLHSASGGPTVDEKGRAWAVNSEIIPLESVVIVSPLSMTADNKLVTGIHQVFLSDACFGNGDKEPHKCQVIPNRFEENNP